MAWLRGTWKTALSDFRNKLHEASSRRDLDRVYRGVDELTIRPGLMPWNDHGVRLAVIEASLHFLVPAGLDKRSAPLEVVVQAERDGLRDGLDLVRARLLSYERRRVTIHESWQVERALKRHPQQHAFERWRRTLAAVPHPRQLPEVQKIDGWWVVETTFDDSLAGAAVFTPDGKVVEAAVDLAPEPGGLPFGVYLLELVRRRERIERATVPAGTIGALQLAFFLNGATFASWFQQMEAARTLLHLSPSQIGLSLAGITLGLLLGLLTGRHLQSRTGIGLLLVLAMAGYTGGMALPALAIVDLPPGTTLTWLALGMALAVPAFSNGVLDSVVNLYAARLKRVTRRALQGRMQSAQASGAVITSLCVPAATYAGIGPTAYLLGLAVVGLTCTVLIAVPLLRARAGRAGYRDPRPDAAIRRPARWLLAALGGMIVAAYAAEGVFNDWSRTALQQSLNAQPWVATLGVTAFSVSAATMRWLTDWFLARFEPWLIALATGTVATIGAVVFVNAPAVELALLGAVLLGAGVGPLAPLAFDAVGADDDDIFLVTMAGFLSLVTLPIVIGMLAHEPEDVQSALWLLVGLTGLAVTLAWAPGRRSNAA